MSDNNSLAVVGTITLGVLSFWSGLWWLGLIFVNVLVLLVMALLPATWPPQAGSQAETPLDRIEDTLHSIDGSQWSD